MLSSSDYFRRLERLLALDAPAQDELMRELGDHVEDRVDALIARGLTEHEARRQALAGFGRPETFAHLIRQARFNTRWREALLAAVPSLTVAALLALGLWRQPAVAATFAVTIVGVTLFGLWRGRPVWFYPWAGVALTFPFLAGYLAFVVLSDHAAPVFERTASPLDMAAVAGAMVYFPLGLLVVATALLIALQRDWLDASVLLTPLPPALAWLIHMHGDGGLFATSGGGNVEALIAFVYAALGVATVAVLRAPSRRLRIGALAGGSVLVLTAATLAQADFDMVALAARSVVLIAFLMSPAILAQRYG